MRVMSYETLKYEQDEHVVVLTYNRPQQHNAISRRMNAELHEAFRRFRDDDSAFVLVITGAGETTFCAGWDLQDAAEWTELGDFDQYRKDLYNLPGVCGYTRRVDIFKPIIAAVNGYAFAAGLETAMLADIRIAAENAEFGALERAVALAHEIAALPQGAIRSDKECLLRHVGRTLEERLRIEAEMIISMFMRRDKHSFGAASFKAGNLKPNWPN